MVAGFPLALWAGGTVWDVVGVFWPGSLWAALAFWTLSLGLLASIPAFGSGFAELISLPANHPAERVAWWHMGFMSVAFCCFLGSVLLRRGPSGVAEEAGWLEISLALLGTLVAFGGGWLGGELVFRHGVGVENRVGAKREKIE